MAQKKNWQSTKSRIKFAITLSKWFSVRSTRLLVRLSCITKLVNRWRAIYLKCQLALATRLCGNPPVLSDIFRIVKIIGRLLCGRKRFVRLGREPMGGKLFSNSYGARRHQSIIIHTDYYLLTRSLL